MGIPQPEMNFPLALRAEVEMKVFFGCFVPKNQKKGQNGYFWPFLGVQRFFGASRQSLGKKLYHLALLADLGSNRPDLD